MQSEFQKIVITRDNLSEHLESLISISKKFWEFYLVEGYTDQYDPKPTDSVNFGYMEDEIRDEESYCEIVYKEGRPVAFLIGLFEDNSLYYNLGKFGLIDELFVDEQVRGSGIGKQYKIRYSPSNDTGLRPQPGFTVDRRA